MDVELREHDFDGCTAGIAGGLRGADRAERREDARAAPVGQAVSAVYAGTGCTRER